MKTLILMIAMLATSVAFAKSDSQITAEKLFDSMTPAQAIASKKFSQRAWNRNLPGTSTWMGPGNICINGGNIETVKPMTVCNEWRVDLKDSKFGKSYKTFTSRSRARNYADESSNAKGSEYCSDSELNYYSHPINWQVQTCVKWAVKVENGSTKTFTSEAKADNYAEESSNAKGQAYCIQEGIVNKSFNTVFKVDFFRKTAHDKYDSKKFLGSHKYTYQSCTMQDLTPVPAN